VGNKFVNQTFRSRFPSNPRRLVARHL